MSWTLEPLDGPVADTLDLHGMTWSEAEPAVVAFLNRVRKRQPGALVHVITGKGRGSPGHPVLKTRDARPHTAKIGQPARRSVGD